MRTLSYRERTAMPRVTATAEPIAPLILVVEDDPFIALDLEHTLKREGYYVLGPASSVSAALALLQHADPDAAVLDVTLGSTKVTPLANVLADNQVPFVIASGDTEPFADEVLATARNLGKPTDKAALLQELERLLRKTKVLREH
jgi:two-component system, response regulator PdtaR